MAPRLRADGSRQTSAVFWRFKLENTANGLLESACIGCFRSGHRLLSPRTTPTKLPSYLMRLSGPLNSPDHVQSGDPPWTRIQINHRDGSKLNRDHDPNKNNTATRQGLLASFTSAAFRSSRPANDARNIRNTTPPPPPPPPSCVRQNCSEMDSPV